MAKTRRFSELVRIAGKPEAVTLWRDPKQEPGFMKAVKENRVMTISQGQRGARKDFGRIGFHQEPLALYLVFPKRLPKDEISMVVGIKYEQIAEPKVKDPISTKELAQASEANQKKRGKKGASRGQKGQPPR